MEHQSVFMYAEVCGGEGENHSGMLGLGGSTVIQITIRRHASVAARPIVHYF